MSFNARLSDIAEIVMGQSPKGNEVNDKQIGLPLLNGPTEFSERYPNPVQFTEDGKRFAQKGDILFCVRGSTTGRMNYADQSYAIGRGIGAIRGANGFPTAYVKAVLEQSLPRLLQAATGSTFPNVSRDILNSLEINSVDVEAAKVINKFLVALEEKSFLNNQINQTLEQIAQALFKSWFVDFDPVKAKIAILEAGGSEEEALLAAMQVISSKNAEELAAFEVEKPEEYAQLRATAELFPAAMVESELGEIPEGWEAGEIGDVTSVRGGYAFKGKDFVTTGNPVIKIKNITSTGTVSTLGCDCIDDELAKPASRFKLSDGDILMAMTGATVGKSGIYVSDGRDGYLNQRVAKFESDIESSMPCWFTYNLINRGNVFEQIVGAAQGSAQPNISAKGIEQVNTVIPSIPLIKQYQKLVTPLYGQWIAKFKESKQLSELRDTLLPKLLSGEIDLSSMEK